MTEDNPGEDHDYLRRLFADPPPPDVVPGEGLTREDLRRMNDATGTVTTGTLAGEVVCDVDGIPTGVGESQTFRTYFGGVVITQSDADRLGYTPEEFPNIRVLPDPTIRQEKP